MNCSRSLLIDSTIYVIFYDHIKLPFSSSLSKPPFLTQSYPSVTFHPHLASTSRQTPTPSIKIVGSPVLNPLPDSPPRTYIYMPHLPPVTPIPTPASIFSGAPIMTPAIQVPTPSGPRNGPDIPGAGKFKVPKLRLECRDLSHPGAAVFLSSVNAAECLAKAAQHVLALLYESPTCPTTTIPTTRSVTVILRSMSGVAYTTGSDLDSDHKEIHFSVEYIANIHPISRRTEEINGVLTHELVHCLQYNGHGTCPGGLIEGIADWVRLHCLLSPPHWKRDSNGKWDAGYQQTAYFLDYLEERFGKGTIRRLNEKLRIQKYEEKPFWTELVGRPVEQLWGDYKEKLES